MKTDFLGNEIKNDDKVIIVFGHNFRHSEIENIEVPEYGDRFIKIKGLKKPILSTRIIKI